MSGYSGRSFRFFRPAAVPGIDNALILFDLKCHLKKETYLSKKKKQQLKREKKKVSSELFHSREQTTNTIMKDKK